MMKMLINRCAQALLGHCGMQPRDVIGLLLPNIPEFIIVCHGALEAGLTVTFVNPLYTPGLSPYFFSYERRKNSLGQTKKYFMNEK